MLPSDRVDTMYHSYDGGDITITGPSVLIRKSVSDSVSISANHYVDSISSASIDVQTIIGPSRYKEERTQQSLGIDYLHDKSLMSFSFTKSAENDFDAQTLNFGMTQEMFGGLTTVSMSFRLGDNEIRETGAPTTNEVSETKGYRIGLSQVLTKNSILGLNYEIITDEGFLNNPYRKVRLLDPSGLTFSFQDEIYPKTRTSNAISFNAKYYLPYRAALHASYRYFVDSWEIQADTFEIGYTHPYEDNWIFDISYRFYSQSNAEFYSDLFTTSKTIWGRDKELSTYSGHTIGFAVSYEFGKGDDWFFDKSSVNFHLNHFIFNYDDFTNIPDAPIGTLPGEEPLYEFSANVIRLYLSVWF